MTHAAPATGRVLYRDGALADGRSATLQRNVSILVEDGRIAWIRPTGGEEDASGATVIDSAGATFVPGMVDCHSHVTGPGGANWIERFNDPPEALLAAAEHNGRDRHGTPVCAGCATSARRSAIDPEDGQRARAGHRRPRPMGGSP